MKSLRVLTLTGNPVISKITNYRKSLTLACVSSYFHTFSFRNNYNCRTMYNYMQL